MLTMFQKLAMPALLLCGSVALAQAPATNPAAPPSTQSKPPGAKPDGTTTTGSSTLTGSFGTLSIGSAAKKPAPGSLEEMLDMALRNNPDILAAEAKVRDAEAESNRVRHHVIAKIVQLRNDIDLAKKMLANAQKIEGFEQKAKSSQIDILVATTKVDTQKAELARLEGDLKAVLGSYTQIKGVVHSYTPLVANVNPSTIEELSMWSLNPDNFNRSLDHDLLLQLIKMNSAVPGSVQAPMAERIKAALEKQFKLGFAELSLADTVNVLSTKVGDGVTFRVLAKFENTKLSFAEAEMPLGAWLQMFEDSVPGLRFMVRDYGILATSTDAVPEGAMTVQQFWKQKAKPLTSQAVPGSPAPKKWETPMSKP